MSELLSKRKRLRALLLIVGALGCTSATFSGTFAVFAYSAQPFAEAAAQQRA